MQQQFYKYETLAAYEAAKASLPATHVAWVTENDTVYYGSGRSGQSRNMTHAQLRQLRDEGRLVPGSYYRITDYVTTTMQQDTMSAGHAFDILVRAASPGTLLEEAHAILHEGSPYFKDSRLEAWELKYCLDNDTDRFAWADTEEGKGVIYRLKDEWGNDLPYDFKNIMFKRSYCEPEQFGGEGRYLAIPGMQVGPDMELLPEQDDENFIYVYTFSCLASLEEDPSDKPAQADASMGLFQTENEMQADYGDSPRPVNNVMEAYYVSQSIDDEPLRKVQALLNITFQQIYTDEYSYHCSDNHFSGTCHDLSCRSKNFFNNDFAEAKVEYCYFSGANVCFCNFSGAYLENNNFSGAHLESNSFSGADVRFCNFSGAHLESNSFSGAEIWNNNFSGAYIYYNTFSGADVRFCNFSGTYLENNNFSGAYIWHNNFSGADVRFCNFSGAEIWNNNFSGAYLENNNFSGASIGECTFSGASIGECTFSGANVCFCNFSGNIRYSSFSHASYCIFGTGTGSGAWQHVRQTGYLHGTSESQKLTVSVALGAEYEQVVTPDKNGNLKVVAPWI